MKRAGFTMIELIFVIVILGILAAVAVPKLAATRTDAEVSKGMADIGTLITDLGSYYTAQGTFSGKSTNDITNVKLQSAVTSLADSSTITYVDDNNNSCITITFNNVADGNITLANGTVTTGVCAGIQSAAADRLKTYVFGGSSVNR